MRQGMRMRFVRPLALVVALLVAWNTGCGRPAGKSDRSNASGTTPGRTDHGPARIISCAPNLTEMLFALGAGEHVIGVTRFCQFPPEARTRPPLGDLYNPNLEAMVAARPDLIVFVPGSTKIRDFFAAHPGPRLLETNACETVAEIQATLLRLGAALGDSSRAAALVSRISAGLDSVRAESAGAPPVRYLMVLGHDEGALEQVYVVGQPTYLTELLALSCGVNVVDAAAGRYPIVTREALLAMNPDVILERHLGPATPADRAALEALWRSLPTLEAVRTGRIAVQDDDHVTINGPDLVATARKLARLLRGGATATDSATAAPAGSPASPAHAAPAAPAGSHP